MPLSRRFPTFRVQGLGFRKELEKVEKVEKCHYDPWVTEGQAGATNPAEACQEERSQVR